MFSLSVKDLRGKLPFVRGELKKGSSFLIIYKSRPIAKLTPVDALDSLDDTEMAEVEACAIDDLNDDYLTEEELNYYLALK
jgi:antitoxin (DNA-binding transcriptional repressor) of toxin-antitoxin stability system